MTPDEKKQVVRDSLRPSTPRISTPSAPTPASTRPSSICPTSGPLFTNLRSAVDHITIEGDLVATVVTVTGIHSGSFIGETPTGDEISFIVLGMDRVENGKITLHYATPDLFPFVLMGIGHAAAARRP